MRHKLMSLCLAMLLVLAMPVTAAAEEFDAEQTGSISITLLEKEEKMPITGAEFSLYQVASGQISGENEVDYTYTAEFADADAAPEELNAGTLDALVDQKTQPAATSVTDENGNAAFTDLSVGLYFVKQTRSGGDYAPCTPFLVEVPNKSTQGYVYNIKASPKTEVVRLADVTVKKVWNADEGAQIPESITVQLLRNQAVVETVELNAQNNWTVTFYDMPESDSYSIAEINAPEGFTVTYSQRGYEFTVTNSAIPLAQTGQLVWPIPVLAVAGLFLIGLGAVVLLKSRDDHA